MEARGMSDYTVHAAARSIRVFLRFCVREEYIASSPMTKVAMPRIDKRILPALAPDEVHRLLNVCTSERDQAIVVFLLDTGCRVSELVNLDIADVDMKSGEVTIRRGKGRKDRVVFLGLTARRMLAAYFNERGSPDPDQPVWVSQTRSERLTLSGAQQLLRRLGQAAGVEHCSPHSFRRTFAIWSLRNGMDLFRLARLLGHTDISVLRQYLDLLRDDLAAAHAQFVTVDRMLVP
jgi:site-specific recombinase XerD